MARVPPIIHWYSFLQHLCPHVPASKGIQAPPFLGKRFTVEFSSNFGFFNTYEKFSTRSAYGSGTDFFSILHFLEKSCAAAGCKERTIAKLLCLFLIISIDSTHHCCLKWLTVFLPFQAKYLKISFIS